MKSLIRNLFIAAILLPSGGFSSMAIAQSQTPATSDATAKQPSRAQQLYGDISPKMAELTDNLLYGDIWERPGLSKRDRSLVGPHRPQSA